MCKGLLVRGCAWVCVGVSRYGVLRCLKVLLCMCVCVCMWVGTCVCVCLCVCLLYVYVCCVRVGEIFFATITLYLNKNVS